MAPSGYADGLKADSVPNFSVHCIEFLKRLGIAEMRNPDEWPFLTGTYDIFKNDIVVKSGQAFVGVDGRRKRDGISFYRKALPREPKRRGVQFSFQLGCGAGIASAMRDRVGNEQ